MGRWKNEFYLSPKGAANAAPVWGPIVFTYVLSSWSWWRVLDPFISEVKISLFEIFKKCFIPRREMRMQLPYEVQLFLLIFYRVGPDEGYLILLFQGRISAFLKSWKCFIVWMGGWVDGWVDGWVGGWVVIFLPLQFSFFSSMITSNTSWFQNSA